MDKVSTPSLSIVIPTREGFADHWFNALTEVKGEVEFILATAAPDRRTTGVG